MGINDRDYIRTGTRSKSGMGSLRLISFNSWLIIINVAVFLIDGSLLKNAARPVLTFNNVPPMTAHSPALLSRGPQAVSKEPGSSFTIVKFDPGNGMAVGQERYTMMTPAQAYGHFSTELGFNAKIQPPVWKLPEVWRFVTFQFLHAGFWHLAVNMFGLFVFGGMVEQYLGFKKYAAYYLVCGVFGAVMYLFLNLLGQRVGLRLPGVLVENSYTPLVGASAGVFGVIIACAKVSPNAVFQLAFPPIPMKIKYIAYGYVALAMLNLLRGGQNAGGDAAHVGGAIAGFFFIRNSHLLRDFFDVVGDSRKNPPKPAQDFRREIVDDILAKVSAQGLASLTDGERAILKRETEQGQKK